MNHRAGLLERARAEVDGVSVGLSQQRGDVVAMVERCTHRGGPLADGPIADGWVECPWPHSRLSLDDGSVVQDPATRPPLKLDVRISAGRVEVSRPATNELCARILSAIDSPRSTPVTMPDRRRSTPPRQCSLTTAHRLQGGRR